MRFVSLLCATTIFAGGSMFTPPVAAAAQPEAFAEWPAGKSPQEVGKRVSEAWVKRELEYVTRASRRFVIYPEVCTWYGALTVAKLTNDTELQRKLVVKFDPLLNSDYGRISHQAHVDYRVFGALPLEIAMQTKNPFCLELGLKLANAQWENPTEDGITREARYWIDDMYMVSAVQVQAFRATGDKKHLDWAARAMAQYLDRIQQPNGLFIHAPDSPFYWGRGNGWQSAGMAELLQVLPADHPQRARIVEGGRKMMAALLTHQAPEGLWRQLVDKPETWLETSGSAMFAFGMVSGVKDGWLDAATYGPAARKAWLALVEQLDENALLREVCVGTNKAGQYHPNDLDAQYKFYLARERETGNLHGQAPMLWTATALMR